MALWKKMPAPARDVLRRPARADRWERDAIASRLMRYRDKTGDDWADIIDMPDDASGCATASRALAQRDDASSDHVRGTGRRAPSPRCSHQALSVYPSRVGAFLIGAGEGNRTPVSSLGSLRSAIEPHPRGPAAPSDRTEV
jgi:hypothetical protein